jgi:hypothetical protein
MGLPSRTVAASSALAGVLALAYLAWAPESQDLAAATFRADLFAEHGFTLWNNAWYDGHYLLSYSVLYPPLAALLGVRVVGVLAVVVGAAAFAALANRRFEGERALVPSLWFAAALAVWLLTGRMPFLLAVPFALAALLVRTGWAGALLAALATLASPVTGLFVGLAGVSLAIAGERARGIWLAIGAGVPMLALNLAFPVGGVEPFVFSAFVAIPLLAAVVLWLVPPEFRAVRIGAVLYALGALAAFVVDTPLGGNVTRLGALLAGPLLALLVWPRGRWIVLAVSVPLLYWQLIAPVRDVTKAGGDPSTERAFYEPLLAELDGLGAPGTFRLHIPPTKNRWEAAYVAPDYPIARGWLRQLESDDFDLFTDGTLTPSRYLAWLEDHAVSYVAVPDAPSDYLAEDEIELIDGDLPYLESVWSNADWRLYEIDAPPSIGPRYWDLRQSGVRIDGPDSFSLHVKQPGEHSTGITWSRYWHVTEGEGCVVPHGDERTTVVVAMRGHERLEVEQRFDLGGGDVCSD